MANTYTDYVEKLDDTGTYLANPFYLSPVSCYMMFFDYPSSQG
jgi:hypothetical protein